MPDQEFWILFDPSGCAAGSTATRNAATADAAMAMLVPDRIAQWQLLAKGWHIERVDGARFEAAVPCMTGDCGHEGVRADA